MKTIRQAAVAVLIGAVCLVISALVPWVSAFGVVSAHLPGYGVGVVLLLGCGSGALGGVALRGRVPVPIMVLMWVLVGVDVLVLFVLLALLEADSGWTGALVQPAAGFWLALVGVLVNVGATIAVQIGVSMSSTGRRTVGSAAMDHRQAIAIPESGNAVTLSPDGLFWWNGQQWLPVSGPAPAATSGPGAAGSIDEKPWWNGETWIPGAPSPRSSDR